MAPEQLTKQRIAGRKTYKVGKKTDVWALGCILHYMAFSATPYHSITNQREKFENLCNMRKKVPIKISKFEVLNRILREKILVKDVVNRATTEEVLEDEFFNEESFFSFSQTNNISSLDNFTSTSVTTNMH